MKKIFRNNKLVTTLALSLSVAPLVAPLAKAASPSMPIGNLLGLPGDTYTYNLQQVFGTGSSGYSVINSLGTAVSVQVSGSMLQIVLKAAGKSDIQLSAQTAAGTVTKNFSVQVIPVTNDRFNIGDITNFAKNASTSDSARDLLKKIDPHSVPKNHAPTVQRAVYEISIPEGHTVPSVAIDSSFFTDQDGDNLTYQIYSSDNQGLSATVSGSNVLFSGMMPSADVSYTITAFDNHGTDAKTASSVLTIKPAFQENFPPVSVVGDTYGVYYPLNSYANVSVNWSDLFMDHEHDSLTYTVVGATYSNGVTASVYASTLNFSGVLSSNTQFAVQATDSHGGTSAPLTVRLGEVVSKYHDLQVYYELNEDGTEAYGAYIDFSDLFIGNGLTYEVTPPSTQNNVTPFPSGSYVEFHGDMTADTTFTVTAHNSNGRSDSTNIHLIKNHIPTVTASIDPIVVPVGEYVAPTSINLSDYFRDIDSDALQFILNNYSDAPDFSISLNGNTITYSGNMGPNGYAEAEVLVEDGKGGQNLLYLRIKPKSVYAVNKIMNAYLYKSFTGDIAVVDLKDNFKESLNRGLTYEVDSSSIIPSGYTVTVSGDYLHVSKSAAATEATMPDTFDVKIKATEQDTAETGETMYSGYGIYRFNEFSKPVTVNVDSSGRSADLNFDMNDDLIHANKFTYYDDGDPATFDNAVVTVLDRSSNWLSASGSMITIDPSALTGDTATVSLAVYNGGVYETKPITFKVTDFGSKQLHDRTITSQYSYSYDEVALKSINKHYDSTNLINFTTDPINYQLRSYGESAYGELVHDQDFIIKSSYSPESTMIGLFGLDASTGNGFIDTFAVNVSSDDGTLSFANPFTSGEAITTSNIISSNPKFDPKMTVTDSQITIDPNYIGTGSEFDTFTTFTISAYYSDGSIAGRINVNWPLRA